MQLSDYFQPDFVERALERYAAEPWGKLGLPWKPILYAHSIAAFGTEMPGDEQFKQFSQIFSQLRSYWGTHRNGRVWEVQRLFHVLTAECRNCALHTGITCLDLSQNEIQQKVATCLHSVEEVKPTKDQSPMAMSKYLHFFNPMLFPIYDNEWVRRKVLKVFSADWAKTEAWSSSASERVQKYMRYLLLAHDCMAGAARNIMDVFFDWLMRHSGMARDESGLDAQVRSFYAAAFEFVAIGAALLELDWRDRSRESFKQYAEAGSDPTLVQHLLSLTPHQRLVLLERRAHEAQLLYEYGRKHREDKARQHR